MYKGSLPSDCPPASASEIEQDAFRICKGNALTDGDLQPYTALFPNNIRYREMCQAHALSFFDSVENARAGHAKAMNNNRNLGDFLVKVKIVKETGQVEYNAKTGHLSLWLYQNWIQSNFEIIEIIRVNGN